MFYNKNKKVINNQCYIKQLLNIKMFTYLCIIYHILLLKFTNIL